MGTFGGDETAGRCVSWIVDSDGGEGWGIRGCQKRKRDIPCL